MNKTMAPYSQAAPAKSGFSAKKWRPAIFWTLMTVYGILTLYPLFWLFISAFKTNAEFLNRPFSLPLTWQIDNFVKAWSTSKMGTAFVNSVIVSLASLAITLFVSALSSFVLARLQFRFKGWILGFFVVGMLIPIHSTLKAVIYFNEAAFLIKYVLGTYFALHGFCSAYSYIRIGCLFIFGTQGNRGSGFY